MKFVALVSGGKDSCYNILHCLANGHELVCLANLYPPAAAEDSEDDEIDSYMYQTVGHEVLQYYAQCIGKPLYTQMISGSAVNQKLEYEKTLEDETEDLTVLLRRVKEEHPDVEAVSVGAILSNYQRTRVEDVCSRLGLVSLAYLWQRDQDELMGEMCESGLEAILIKVAAIGLNQSHLGLTLPEAYPELQKLNTQFGVNVCGEGGEFETLVLDAPFFKHGRLVIRDRKVVRHTNDEVWFLKLKVEVVPKEDFAGTVSVVAPPLLREPFRRWAEEIKYAGEKCQVKSLPPVSTVPFKTNFFTSESTLYASNLFSSKSSVEDQIRDIFEQLRSFLEKSHLSFTHVQSCDLFISDMADFAKVNEIYKGYFTQPLPPARCCMETRLPVGLKALLSVRILPDLESKQGLHVQGRSYWAPSNIGPYSQTIINWKAGCAHLSGQIPLVPKNMELCSDPVDASILALQHLDNVKRAVKYESSVVLVAYITDESWLPVVLEVHRRYESSPNFAVVQVTQLPKGAGVEWGGVSGEVEAEVRFDELGEGSEASGVHYTVYSALEDLPAIQTAYEFSPALQVWDSNGVSHRYALVIN